MAKDVFYRSKPHVNVGNVGAIFGLRKMGFSGLGVSQIANAQEVSDPQDRRLAAEMLEDAASGLPTGKRQHKPCSVTKPRDPLVPFNWRRLGFSDQGIQQLALGNPVTGPEDRGLLCEVLMRHAAKEVKYYTITLTK